MKKDTPWKVAVVGCGSFATGQYLPNISKTANAVLTAVCDIRTDVAEAACKRFGAKEWYGSVEELVEKGDFDIAIDAASIPAHDHINKTILSAGKHLFRGEFAGKYITFRRVDRLDRADIFPAIPLEAAPRCGVGGERRRKYGEDERQNDCFPDEHEKKTLFNFPMK